MKAVGLERGGYGRGSKVLLGWTRSQINLAPFKQDSNEQIIVASGKCNNAKEFDNFGAILDPATKTYAVDDSIDVGEWAAQMASSGNSSSSVTIQDVADIVKEVGRDGMAKKMIAASLKAMGVSNSYAYKLIDRAAKQKLICQRKSDLRYVFNRKILLGEILL